MPRRVDGQTCSMIESNALLLLLLLLLLHLHLPLPLHLHVLFIRRFIDDARSSRVKSSRLL